VGWARARRGALTSWSERTEDRALDGARQRTAVPEAQAYDPVMATPFASLFASAEGGDSDATAALFASLYSELHRMARHHLGRSHGMTLGTTTLLHEAYLSVSKRDASIFPDRSRFMAYASRAMRGVIIDYARSRRAQKRGGEFHITPFVEDLASPETDDQELVRIGDALDELTAVDPALAQVVDLKFFCGFSFDEIAAMQKVSKRTVQRHWERARVFLHGSVRGASLP
jgi:RNA polymerase sigma factor (TIGR02999 family)